MKSLDKVPYVNTIMI